MNLEYSSALADFGALIDPRTGLIRNVEVTLLPGADPPIFVAHATPCDTTPLTGTRAEVRSAACSAQVERAILRACGESIERYCAAFFETDALRIASERELAQSGERFVRVHDVHPFAPEQYTADFPFQRMPDDQPIRWVRGQSLSTAETVWLPASIVYVPYCFDPRIEPVTHEPVATGLAAGRDVRNCIRKGIFEILERDVLTICWHAAIAAPRVDVESCRGLVPAIDGLLSTGRPGGPTWRINWLTLDIGIPVLSAALVDSGAPGLSSLGVAAHENPLWALQLALEEAALNRVSPRRTAAAAGDELRFLGAGPLVSFEDVASRVDGRGAAQILEERGYEAFWVDVTTPDVRDFGFCVVRTVVPGMQPLDSDRRHRCLGGRRLSSVPERLGLLH